METTNNTSEARDQGFQERLETLKARIQSKVDEAFAPPKVDEETPEPEEDDPGPPPEPKFNLTQDTFDMILGRMIRDEAFFKRYRKWWPSHYFAPLTPTIPVTMMVFIFEKAVEHYDKHGSLISKEALIQEIKDHLKQVKPGSENEEDWYTYAEKLFTLDLESSFVKFTEDKMIRLIKHQATVEKLWTFHRDKMRRGNDTDSDRCEFSKEIDEIAKLGVDEVEEDIGIDSEEFLKLEFPARKIIIDPWLKEGSVGMIAGQMGSGKTFLDISIANGVTTETSVGNWIVKNPIPCVYVDGELEYREMQDRLRNLRIGNMKRKLTLISDSFNVSTNRPRINNLLDPNQRATLFKICEKSKDKDLGILLILDNISVLCPGIDENKKSDWDPINVWFLDLKKSGVNSLYLHHTGKSGDQRGTSGREDNIDTSILLSIPKDYKTEDGCRFNLHFKKKRVEGQYLHLIRDEEWKLNTKENPHEWMISTSTKKSSDEIFLLLAQGMGVTKIAKSLKISHSYVSKIKNKLTAHGYFNMKGDLTEKGKQRLDSSTQDDDLEDE